MPAFVTCQLLRYGFTFCAVIAAIAALATITGGVPVQLCSKDLSTWLVCSKHEGQLFVGFMKVDVRARLTEIESPSSPVGSFYFMWELPDKNWGAKNLGPNVDVASVAGMPALEAWFAYWVGRDLTGKFTGFFLCSKDLRFSFSKADEPVYRADHPKIAEYRPNGATSIEINVPGWLLFVPLASGFIPMCSRRYLEIRSRRRQERSRCRLCGYDLRGSPSQCPECGTVP